MPIVDMLLENGWETAVFAWGGALFDLLIVPALLWRPTRLAAFGFAVAFHFTNSQIFSIGIFPWMMIAATTVFFAPNWPRRLVAFLTGRPPAGEMAVQQATAILRSGALVGMLAYVGVQIALPLRHHAYPGNPEWTEEGHRFAWRMKLRNKHGVARFFVTTANVKEEVNLEHYLRPWQVRMLAIHPDMMIQFAHFLSREYESRAGEDVRVYVQAEASLNGRPYTPLVDPSRNLAREPRSLLPARWIAPLPQLPAQPSRLRSADSRR